MFCGNGIDYNVCIVLFLWVVFGCGCSGCVGVGLVCVGSLVVVVFGLLYWYCY